MTMRHIGVVLFGASKFDRLDEDENPRFANSARQFRRIFESGALHDSGNVNVLDLFDSEKPLEEVLETITDFVSGNVFDDVVLFHCGHGIKNIYDNRHYAFLRKTSRKFLSASAVDSLDFVRQMSDAGGDSRVYLIWDCCFSGAIIDQKSEGMDAADLSDDLERRMREAVPRAGVVVMTATQGDDYALAKNEDSVTLFSGTLIQVIDEGINGVPRPTLSWSDAHAEACHRIRRRRLTRVPIPRIVLHRDVDGDASKVPFFVNRAYKPPHLYDLPDVEKLVHIGEYNAVERKGSISDHGRFIQGNPKSMYVHSARETLARMIANEHSIKILEAFCKEFDGETFVIGAKHRLADIIWPQIATTASIPELEQFIRVYDFTPPAFEARKRAAELRSKDISATAYHKERYSGKPAPAPADSAVPKSGADLSEPAHDIRVSERVDQVPGRVLPNFPQWILEAVDPWRTAAVLFVRSCVDKSEKKQRLRTAGLSVFAVPLFILCGLELLSKMKWLPGAEKGIDTTSGALLICSSLALVFLVFRCRNWSSLYGQEKASYWLAACIPVFVLCFELSWESRWSLPGRTSDELSVFFAGSIVLVTSLVLLLLRWNVWEERELPLYWLACALSALALLFFWLTTYEIPGGHSFGLAGSAVLLWIGGWLIWLRQASLTARDYVIFWLAAVPIGAFMFSELFQVGHWELWGSPGTSNQITQGIVICGFAVGVSGYLAFFRSPDAFDLWERVVCGIVLTGFCSFSIMHSPIADVTKGLLLLLLLAIGLIGILVLPLLRHLAEK
jgi:hypothetical protein